MCTLRYCYPKGQYRNNNDDRSLHADDSSSHPVDRNTNLCKDWFAMVCHHHSLLTVEDNRCVLERFLAVLENIVEIRDSSFKHATEIPWDQAATNSYKQRRKQVMQAEWQIASKLCEINKVHEPDTATVALSDHHWFL